MKPLATAVWVLLLAIGACGPSARQKTINTTLSTLNVAADNYVKFDAVHQKALVDESPNRAIAEQKLADYRETQTKVLQAFAMAYRAVAVAQQVNDDQSLSSMAQAALIVAQELQALGVLP